MSATPSERTLRMKEEYVAFRDKGYGPREIAAFFGLGTSTVYCLLDEISASTGISREDLLVAPSRRPIHPNNGSKNRVTAVPEIDTHAVLERFNKAAATIEELVRRAEQSYNDRIRDTERMMI